MEGKEGFIHKSRGRTSSKKKDAKIIEDLKNLYLSEYYDYNFCAFYEEIEEKYDISYSVMCKEFLNDDIISPIAHKKTIKVYNERMKNAIEKSKKNNNQKVKSAKFNLYNERLEEQEKRYTRRSSKHLKFGEEVQLDACEEYWFSDIVTHLHLAVDRATKVVLFGWFEYEELTRGYFVLLYHILLNYGIPYKIKTDNRSTFSTNRKKNKDSQTTQFSRICGELEIKLETSSIAVSKPNVERANSTFKNRLIAELRHEKITDIDSANDYLNNVFIPKINSKFAYDYDIKNSKMRQHDYTNEELNLIISETDTRLIDNASSISWKGDYYCIVDSETGEIKNFKHRTECKVIISYTSELWCEIDGKVYCLVQINKREKQVIPKEKKTEKEKKKYIPPKDHPWRKGFK